MFSIQQPLETHLWSTKGGSDKVYNAYLRPKNTGWVVDYTNGPRGGTMRPGTRTQAPLSFEEAHDVYSKLVKSKLKDGYTPVEGSQAYTSSEFADRATGLELQLLTAIDEATCERLLADDNWSLQEKANGERRPLIVKGGNVSGANRNGLQVDVPQQWLDEYGQFGDVEFDGEHVGEVFYVFDLMSHAGADLRGLPFAERYCMLTNLLHGLKVMPTSLRLLKAQTTTDNKRRLLQYVRNNNLEGVVFKRLDAAYDAGRSEAALKFKLVDSATCIVLSHNVQRSVVIGLLDENNELKALGNVTIPANHKVPEIGQLIEVSFLYFTGRAFEQPIYQGPRTDLHGGAARIDQVKRVKPVDVPTLEFA